MAFIFVFISFALMYIDYKETGALFTPFTVVAFPIVILSLYIEFIGSIRGYYNVTLDAYVFLLLNFIFIWLPGQLFFLATFGKLKFKNGFEQVKSFIQKNAIFLLFLLWVAIIAGLFDLFSFIHQYGITLITSKIFKETYGRGILGHLVNLGYPSFLLLVSYIPARVNRKIVLGSIFLMAFVIFVSQTKYHLIIPLTTILILKSFITKKKGIIYKNLVLGGVLISLIFFATYFFGFAIAYGYDNALSSIVFIFSHFECYIIGGPIALGKCLSTYNQNFNIKYLFAVPVNIYHWINGSKEYITSPGIDVLNISWVPISETATTNIYTMFGAVYLTLGYWGTLFFSLILGIISYGIYYITMKTKKIGWIILNSWLLGTLTVSFFSYYFYLLLIWEVAFYSLVIPFLSSILNQILSQNKKSIHEYNISLISKNHGQNRNVSKL